MRKRRRRLREGVPELCQIFRCRSDVARLGICSAVLFEQILVLPILLGELIFQLPACWCFSFSLAIAACHSGLPTSASDGLTCLVTHACTRSLASAAAFTLAATPARIVLAGVPAFPPGVCPTALLKRAHMMRHMDDYGQLLRRSSV